jgi:SH3-like domain-containing protein
VNLRNRPRSDQDNVLMVLPAGTSVEVGGSSGDWLLVRTPSAVGYLANHLVRAFRGGPWDVVVGASAVNLRPGPSTAGAPLGTASPGTVLTAVGCEDQWLRVLRGEGTAFVRARFVAGVDLPVGSLVGAPPPSAEGELTPAMMRAARADALGIADSQLRGDALEALHGRVEYRSQRDNAALEGGARIETRGGRMCNLTALAMALSGLGIDNPDPSAQYEDALEAIRQREGYGKRTSADGWGKVARFMGADVVWVVGGDFKKSRAWWEENVRPALREGRTMMISITGHIVHVRGISAAGVVVNDPYGVTRLDPGTGFGFSKTNPFPTPGNVGQGVVWPWDAVAAHQMHWLAGFRLHEGGAPRSRGGLSFGPQDPEGGTEVEAPWTPLEDVSDAEESNPGAE